MAWQGNDTGAACERHAMCESAFSRLLPDGEDGCSGYLVQPRGENARRLIPVSLLLYAASIHQYNIFFYKPEHITI